MTEDLLWPDYATPDDLATIEAVPLEKRGLPESTYALLTRAATRWPDRTAISVLPDAARWREPHVRTLRRAPGRRPPVREPASTTSGSGAVTRLP